MLDLLTQPPYTICLRAARVRHGTIFPNLPEGFPAARQGLWGNETQRTSDQGLSAASGQV
jgi:hypothetical protein